MSNLITNNAYRILGLDGSANQKNILKRSKEIINRLKIDDYPEYPLDINLPENFRTEESVNDALKKLQNVKNTLNEYFFWFNIADDVDENACEHLQYDDAASIDEAIQIWKNASNTENSTALLYKKNLAILYCLILLNEENDIYLEESLSNWKEIIDSDKFWITFEQSFSVNTDQTINSDSLSDFRKNILKHISDIYHDLYLQHQDKKYVKDFQNLFGTLGKKTEESLLNPIQQSIYETIEKLKGIDLDEESDEDETDEEDYVCDNCDLHVEPKMYTIYDNGSILCDVCKREIGKEWKQRIKEEETVQGSGKTILKIQRIVKQLQSQIDQLHEIGLYDDVQSKVVRDHVSEAIRSSAILIHNKAHMKAKSIELLALAQEIAGSENIKNKMQTDMKTIDKFIEEDDENALTMVVGGFLRKKELIIKGDYIQFKKKKIFYNDFISIALIQDKEEWDLSIKSIKDKMKIPFPNSDDMFKVYERIMPIVKPVIVDRIVKSIFEDDQTITIGKVNFDKNGFHTSKLFRSRSVLWQYDLYPPQLNQGIVFLFENENNSAKEFAAIPVREHNAIMLPDLIDACFKEFHMRNQN